MVDAAAPAKKIDFLFHKANHWTETKSLVIAELPTSSEEFDKKVKSLDINCVSTADKLDLILDFIKNKEKLKSNSRFY